MKSVRNIGFFLAFFSAYVFSAPSVLLQGGVNLSSTTNQDTVAATKSMRRGFNIAIGLEQEFRTHFSLVTGFSLETRGENKEINQLAGGRFPQVIEQHVNFLYLQIPLFAQFNLPLGPGKLNIFAGPELGIMLNSKRYSDQTTTVTDSLGAVVAVTNVKDTVDFSKNVTPFDGGISAGFGYELNLWRGGLFLRPSYYYGLTNYFTDQKGIHNNIKVAIGYKFNISKQ